MQEKSKSLIVSLLTNTAGHRQTRIEHLKSFQETLFYYFLQTETQECRKDHITQLLQHDCITKEVTKSKKTDHPLLPLTTSNFGISGKQVNFNLQVIVYIINNSTNQSFIIYNIFLILPNHLCHSNN